MPTQKPKLILLAMLGLAFFALSEKAQAAIFVDNAATGCTTEELRSHYNPTNRTCTGGSDKVYTTLNDANNGITAGIQGRPTVINIRAGKEYSEKLNITKSWTTWQKYAGDANRPVNNGQWTIDHSRLGLITIKAAGVTLDGIEIKNTGHYPTPPVVNTDRGYGIMVDAVNHATIKNCIVKFIGGSGIYLDSADYVLIENSEVYESDYSSTEHTAKYWSAGIATKEGCDHIIIRGNYVHGCGGEGMNLNRKGEDYLIEYNTVCDTRSAGIFINQIRDVICRYNLVYHTGNTRWKMTYVFGLQVARENWGADDCPYGGYGTNNDIYGNAISGYRYGIGISAVVSCGYTVSNTRFYNNTVIEPWEGGSAVRFTAQGGSGNPIGTGVEFKNNILWQTISTATIASITSGVTWANNLWSKAPTASAQSETDPRHPGYEKMQTSDTALYFNKGSGWDSIVHGSLTGQEFALKPTAREAINKGMTIPGYDNDKKKWNMLLDLNRTNFKEKIFPLVNQNNFGAWDIGAGVYGSGGDPTPPSAPSRLSVK